MNKKDLIVMRLIERLYSAIPSLIALRKRIQNCIFASLMNIKDHSRQQIQLTRVTDGMKVTWENEEMTYDPLS